MPLPVNIKALRKKYGRRVGVAREWSDEALRSSDWLSNDDYYYDSNGNHQADVADGAYNAAEHASAASTYANLGEHEWAIRRHEHASRLHRQLSEHTDLPKSTQRRHREAADLHEEAAGRHKLAMAQTAAGKLGYPPGPSQNRAHLEQMADFLEDHAGGEHAHHALAIREHLHRQED